MGMEVLLNVSAIPLFADLLKGGLVVAVIPQADPGKAAVVANLLAQRAGLAVGVNVQVRRAGAGKCKGLIKLAAFNCVFHVFLGLLSGWEGCPGLAGAW